MDPTKSFENHEPSILNEIVQDGNEKEVVEQNIFTLTQFLLGGIKVKVDVQVFDELCNRISIGVRFLVMSTRIRPIIFSLTKSKIRFTC